MSVKVFQVFTRAGLLSVWGEKSLPFLTLSLESHTLDAIRIHDKAKLFIHPDDARLCIQAYGLNIVFYEGGCQSLQEAPPKSTPLPCWMHLKSQWT